MHVMKKIYLGKNEDGERIALDLEEEEIRMIGLFGSTGSGKSIFHNNLYRELSRLYTPEEIGFVFCDMIRVEFPHWKSEYTLEYIDSPQKAMEFMEAMSDSDEIRNKKYIFLHIEECDMAYVDQERTENAISNILSKTDNVFIIYSTSKLDQKYLAGWLKSFVQLRVVFEVATKEDSVFLLGNDSAADIKIPGQRVMSFNNKQIYCQPFSDEEVNELREYVQM